MNKVGEFYDAINAFAPFSSAEKWDNVGLLIGGRSLPVTRALLALDLTGAVLEEAKRLRAELVITHHPVIFSPLKALDSAGIAYRAVTAGISVISAHTNLDVAGGGVNDALAARIGLQNVRPFAQAAQAPYHMVSVYIPVASVQEVYETMAAAGAGQEGNYSHCGFFVRGEGRFLPLEGANPAIGEVGAVESVEEVLLEMLCAPRNLSAVVEAMKRAHPYEQPSYNIIENHALHETRSFGRVGELANPLAPSDFAAKVRERLGAAGLRFADGGAPVCTVAVLGGSGGDFLEQAKAAGAQAFVTGEIKHDRILAAAELGLTLVEAGHFATENVVMEPLRQELSRRMPGAVITLAQSCTDGMKYLV